jgi:putative nucleotidyltransferase with HDIG domain
VRGKSELKTREKAKTRDDAWRLLCQWTKNKNLRKHALAVEAAMREYASVFNEDEEVWGVVGLLHDFDYEKYPSLDDHPYKGQEILKEEGYSDVVLRGVMAHAPHTKTERVTKLEKTIFAVDELTGFIVAVALVKPNKSLEEVDVKSVKKKMKQKAFAAAVDRDDIIKGTKELGVSLDEHIERVLKAMQNIAADLGL